MPRLLDVIVLHVGFQVRSRYDSGRPQSLASDVVMYSRQQVINGDISRLLLIGRRLSVLLFRRTKLRTVFMVLLCLSCRLVGKALGRLQI